MRHDQRVAHRLATDQVLLDDPLEDRRIALAVPRAFRIHDGNRTAFTDAQAIGLGAQDAALFGEPELLKARFQKLPRDEAAMQVAALRLGLIAAEKDVAPGNRNSDPV